MRTIKFLSIASILGIMSISCSSDDDAAPDVINEEEVITTMNVTLVPEGSNGTTVTLQSQDLDGDGPNAPAISVSGPFVANTTYTGSIELLNETESPAEDITEEVEEEDEEHQFFYALSGIDGSTSYLDVDDDGNPIGIDFTFTTGDASTGSITITLIHEPNKDAEGVSEGNAANAGGETDIAQTFSIEVR